MDRNEVIQCYERAVAPHDGIEIKGAKSANTAINGNMFSFIDDANRLCLRFSEERKTEFNKAHGTSDVIQYGAVMRGYVSLPDKVIGDDDALQKLLGESLEFAKSLKPKPTKRRKA